MEGLAEPVGPACSHGLSSEGLGQLSSRLYPPVGLLAPLTDGETEAEKGGDSQIPWEQACPTQAAWLALRGPGLTLPRVQCVWEPVQEAWGQVWGGRRCHSRDSPQKLTWHHCEGCCCCFLARRGVTRAPLGGSLSLCCPLPPASTHSGGPSPARPQSGEWAPLGEWGPGLSAHLRAPPAGPSASL